MSYYHVFNSNAIMSYYHVLTTNDGAEIDPAVFFGFIGQVFRTRDLPGIADFFESRFDQDPVDWLMRDYLLLDRVNRKMRVSSRVLFQHVGKVSSLSGKRQDIAAPLFNAGSPADI
jgi:hypothetical protein